MDKVTGRTKPNLQAGSGLFSLILAVAIIGLLCYGYLLLDRSADQVSTTIVEAQEAGSSTACRLNLQTLDQALLTWSISHPGEQPTIAKLRRSGVHVPECPDGGLISVLPAGLECSIHSSSLSE